MLCKCLLSEILLPIGHTDAACHVLSSVIDWGLELADAPAQDLELRS
jgi:hypothetical protein